MKELNAHMQWLDACYAAHKIALQVLIANSPAHVRAQIEEAAEHMPQIAHAYDLSEAQTTAVAGMLRLLVPARQIPP